MANWKSLQYMLLSAFAFTAMNALIKHLGDFHSFELVFFRCAGTLLICVGVLRYYKIPFKGNKPKLLVARGLVGVTSMALFFFAIKFIPFGTAVSLRFLAPFFAGILAVLLLKEKMRPIQWVFFTMAFLGVFFIKGFDVRVNNFGLLLILSSAVFSGMVYIFLRMIGKQDHPVVIVFYFMVVATLLSGGLTLKYWITPSGFEWVILLSLGFLGYVAQLFMTKAFQIELASKVAPLKYIEAVFALIVGWIWFGESYTILSLLGIVLVISGMLLNLKIKTL